MPRCVKYLATWLNVELSSVSARCKGLRSIVECWVLLQQSLVSLPEILKQAPISTCVYVFYQFTVYVCLCICLCVFVYLYICLCGILGLPDGQTGSPYSGAWLRQVALSPSAPPSETLSVNRQEEEGTFFWLWPTSQLIFSCNSFPYLEPILKRILTTGSILFVCSKAAPWYILRWWPSSPVCRQTRPG